MKTVTLYKNRPDNNQSADDFSDVPKSLRDSVKWQEEKAELYKNGAKFYWADFKNEGDFSRVEYSNVKYVFDCLGLEIIIK